MNRILSTRVAALLLVGTAPLACQALTVIDAPGTAGAPPAPSLIAVGVGTLAQPAPPPPAPSIIAVGVGTLGTAPPPSLMPPVAAVPEPGTAVLALLGVAALLLQRRRLAGG